MEDNLDQVVKDIRLLIAQKCSNETLKARIENYEEAKAGQHETIVMQLEDKVEKLELRLLNAFQLIKNGKKLPHLKYDQFRKEMDIKRNSEGEKVA